MSLANPTPADLVTRFPAFAAVAPDTLAAVLAEAVAWVGPSWSAGDAPLGVMLYAAHVLTLDGLGTGAEAALGAAGALGFQTLRSGSLQLERGPTPGGGGGTPSLLTETSYGRRFLALLRVNQPAVLVV